MSNTETDALEAPITLLVAAVARGNPGLAGAGILLLDAKGETREHIATYLGSMTALEAQLQALILALKYARPYAPAALVLVLGNETAVRQLNGDYPARHPVVLRALAEIDALLAPFSAASYRLGRGEEMTEASRLADLGIDTRLRPLPAYTRPLPE